MKAGNLNLSLNKSAMLALAISFVGSPAVGDDAPSDTSNIPHDRSSSDYRVPKSPDSNASSFDATSAVDKLEEQRAKLDKKSGNVSLSVSGSVSQQFLVKPK
ncbi:MAG: hypothetical protein CTY31_07580 [Hyphomicrobium sp.]|nr:MAG: hypothetical protein CTY39_04680 [Hyphomicrobium sp.]PPC99761.1 MAG: hypothetical protein CTY31_07580 [Hyphomicrobium sp.]